MMTANVSFARMTSPLGEILVTLADGALTGLYLDGQRGWPVEVESWTEDRESSPSILSQLAEYFDGRRTAFDLPLAPRGTPFQLKVWEGLRAIPFGDTIPYGELARRVGLATSASRAVGAAVGQNPIGIVVPCHRVVGANGSLTGFAAGLDRKRWLLDHEGARPLLR